MRNGLSLFIVGALSFLIHSTAALACDVSRIPTTEQKNIWYCYAASDTVIVFVHGLFSNSRDAWLRQDADPKAPAKFWPQIAVDDKRLEKPAIFLGGYYSKLDSKDYGVREASDELFAGLSDQVDQKPSVLDKKTIIFVAHSLGGVVVRDLLVRRADAFKEKRVGLLLVASPSGGSEYARAAEYVTANGGVLIGQLQPNSDFLRSLDKDFRDLLATKRIPDLVGKELIEHFAFEPTGANAAPWYKKLANYFVDDKIVSRLSASRYFPNEALIPDSDHNTIAKPEGPNSDSHLQLVRLYEQVKDTALPECEAPPYFKVLLDLAVSQAKATMQDEKRPELATYLPILSLERLDQDGRRLIGTQNATIMRDPQSGLHEYAPDPPFPCTGETFQARFHSAPLSGGSFLADAPESATSLCFRRSRAKANEKTAVLRCTEGQSCSVAPNAGMAEECNRRAELNFNPSFITPAYAEPAPEETEVTGKQWVVPSLETIQKVPAELRAGYTEFAIHTGKLSGVDKATHFTYGVRVNGVPLNFDGWPPFSNETLFTGSDGLRLAFAIENLGFSGGEDGYEKIEVELRFYDHDKLLRTEVLTRDDYVSYRHAGLLSLTLSQGEKADWSGLYRPAQAQDRFEVILATAVKHPEIIQDRTDIERRIEYDGDPVIGVVRPPRPDNKNLGLTFGVKLKSGQVRSVFTKEKAGEICRYVLDQAKHGKLPRWLKKSAYLYEFDAERITDTADRGVFRGQCSKLAAAGSSG
jgi:pimeloyl-ACP methyl ester carboxylesterase